MMQISKSPPYPELQPLSPPTPVNAVRQRTDDSGMGYTPLARNRHSPVVQTVAGQLLQRGAALGLLGGLPGELSSHAITGFRDTAALGAGREPSAHQRAQALSTYRQLADQTLEPQGGRLVGIDVIA